MTKDEANGNKAPESADDPFATFVEWNSNADREAYVDLADAPEGL